MGVSEESLDDSDREVFSSFGRMMLSAQLLEYSLFELTHLGKKSEERLEVALRKIEGLLKQSAKDQAKQLSALPDHVRELLIEAIDLRNKLAHGFLIEYRIKSQFDDNAKEWAFTLLNEATDLFDHLSDVLDEHASQKLAERGLDGPLSEEDIEAVRESMRKWSAEMDLPD